jgi:outer membrane protein assembly factor BamB
MFHVKPWWLAVVTVVSFGLVGCGGVGGPDGWGGPVAAEHLIVVPDSDGNLTARDAEGQLQWLFPSDAISEQVGEKVDLEAIYGNPSVVDERIYVGGFDHHLYALELTDGDNEPDFAWRFNAHGDIVGGAAADSTRDIIVIGSGDHGVYGLDMDGLQLWRFATGERVWSTPAFGDELVYTGSMDHSVYALDLEGNEVWSFETDAAIAASPAVVDGVVYIGSYDRALYALDADTGDLLWKFETDNWVWSEAVVEDGTVYIGSMDGSIYALSADDGELLWQFDTGDGIRGRPALADDVLVVANQRGDIIGLNSESGEELWTINEATQADVLSDLALIDEAVYVRDQDGDLLQVDPEEGTASDFSREVEG